MSKFARFGVSTLAVLLMVSLALGGLMGCSNSSSSSPSDDPVAESGDGNGDSESDGEFCTVECAGFANDAAAYKDCIDECMEAKK